jgi:hypothetical protein
MDTLVKRIYGERGELYATSDGRRILLATVAPRFEIYEHSTHVPISGRAYGYGVKTRHFTVTICPCEQTTRKVDTDFLKRVRQYDLSVDVQREDGIFERLHIGNLYPQEIDLYGDWVFASEDYKLTKKLLESACFGRGDIPQGN